MMNPQTTHQTKEMKLRVQVKKHTEPPSPAGEPTKQQVTSCDDLHLLIATRAYELYAERGSRRAHALDDWLEAEQEILARSSRSEFILPDDRSGVSLSWFGGVNAGRCGGEYSVRLPGQKLEQFVNTSSMRQESFGQEGKRDVHVRIER